MDEDDGIVEKIKLMSDFVKSLILKAYKISIGMNDRYKKIILSGFSMAFVKLISVGLNLITVPMTLSYLGNVRYGIWLSISSVLSLLTFADLGLGNGLLNAVTKANANKDVLELKKAISSAFFLLLAIAFALLVIFVLIQGFIDWSIVFNVKTELTSSELSSTISVIVLIIILNIPIGIVQRIHEGFQEGFKFQFWLLLGSIISFGLLVTCIYYQAGLPFLVLAFSSGTLIATIFNAYYLFFVKQKHLRPRFKYFDLIFGTQLIKSGLSFLVLGIFTLIGNSSDDIVIAHTLGNAEIANYEIVKKMYLISMMTQFLIQPMWPAFGDAIQTGDFKWASKTLWKGLKLAIVIGGLISLPIVFFGRDIIFYWLSIEFNPSIGLSLGFFIFVIIANYGGVMSTFFNSGPLMRKQVKMIGLASISALLFKILFSIRFGIAGIIWGTVLGYSIFYLIPSYNLAAKYLRKQNGENN